MKDKNKVGYCSPPKASQFKKGQSGNPKGRPKDTSKSIDNIYDIAILFLKECEQEISINERGESRSITVINAVFKQALSKAAKGDMRSIEFVSTMLSRSAQLKEAYDRKNLRVKAKRFQNEILDQLNDEEFGEVYKAVKSYRERES